jgi:deazaflavin-dependent oxidoreductase (nitroreductase family)
MSEAFLYLTTIGRKTGLERRIEIWFVERYDRHYVVAEMRERAGWVKNLTKDPRVAFSVGTRSAPDSLLARTAAFARVVRHENDRELVSAVEALMDVKYGWSDGLVVELRPTAESGSGEASQNHASSKT